MTVSSSNVVLFRSRQSSAAALRRNRRSSRIGVNTAEHRPQRDGHRRSERSERLRALFGDGPRRIGLGARSVQCTPRGGSRHRGHRWLDDNVCLYLVVSTFGKMRQVEQALAVARYKRCNVDQCCNALRIAGSCLGSNDAAHTVTATMAGSTLVASTSPRRAPHESRLTSPAAVVSSPSPAGRNTSTVWPAARSRFASGAQIHSPVKAPCTRTNEPRWTPLV